MLDISGFCLPEDGDGGPVSPEELQARQDLAARAVHAVHTTGFFALKGHGLSHEEFLRQFDLGKLLIEAVSDEEKDLLTAKIKEDDMNNIIVRFQPFFLMCSVTDCYCLHI